MTRSRLLKRVFRIDIAECEKRQGSLKIIARIEDPILIEKILGHLKHNKTKESAHHDPAAAVTGTTTVALWEQGPPD